jgi:hypothetical protein
LGSGGGVGCDVRRELGGEPTRKRLELLGSIASAALSLTDGVAGVVALGSVARDAGPSASGVLAGGSGGGALCGAASGVALTRRAPEIDASLSACGVVIDVELDADVDVDVEAASAPVSGGLVSDGFHCKVVLRLGPCRTSASLDDSGVGRGGGGKGVSRSSAATGGSRLLMG